MNNEPNNVTVNQKQKDTVFRMLFHDKKNLLDLYNALNDTHYTNEDDLSVETLENAIYMTIKNDLAFILDFHLHLYEHQSTYNPNMPLRDLFYVSSEYQKLVSDVSLYSARRVKIPAPRFVVFYNGIDNRPEREIMKLSDLYEVPETDPALELQVLVLNINAGNNVDLREKCKVLNDYMLYIERIRHYMRNDNLPIQDAVKQAVEYCIKEGILTDFLTRNKAEAINMSIFEYDEEKEMRLFGEAERSLGFEHGMEVGMERGILQERQNSVQKMLRNGYSCEEIAKILEMDIKEVENYPKE